MQECRLLRLLLVWPRVLGLLGLLDPWWDYGGLALEGYRRSALCSVISVHLYCIRASYGLGLVHQFLLDWRRFFDDLRLLVFHDHHLLHRLLLDERRFFGVQLLLPFYH